jgi:hypothetical protein
MKRMLMLVGVAGLFATFASAAVAGPGKGPARQLTGKVTSVTSHSITVKAPTSALTCAARAGLQLGTFMGKRATMTCRMAAGRLVVARVKVLPGKAVRKQSPSTQVPSSSSSPTADDDGDVADDDDGAVADDDPGDDASDDADDPADDGGGDEGDDD